MPDLVVTSSLRRGLQNRFSLFFGCINGNWGLVTWGVHGMKV